jgi:hypothetical protein
MRTGALKRNTCKTYKILKITISTYLIMIIVLYNYMNITNIINPFYKHINLCPYQFNISSAITDKLFFWINMDHFIITTHITTPYIFLYSTGMTCIILLNFIIQIQSLKDMTNISLTYASIL